MKQPTEAEIKDLIRRRDWRELQHLAKRQPVPDLADTLLALSKADRVLFFRVLPRDISSDVFNYLEPRDQDALSRELTDEETRRLLSDLPPDDRTTLIEELPGQATQRLLNLLSPADLREARQLMGYPEESVGRLMTPDYAAVRPEWTIAQAIDHIRRVGKRSETVGTVYVIDRLWHLLDALELQRFVLAQPNETVQRIMDYSYVSLSPLEDREEAVRTMERYDLTSAPVVDSRGVLLGIVTIDDVLDVARAEATEDFHKVAAVRPLRASYRETPFWALFAKRIGWLLVLVAVSLLSSGIIAAYEGTLASVLALAFFIPLLIASGGNTGAQAATLLVRALATDDISPGEWLRVGGKELVVGLTLGISLGLAAAVLGWIRGGGDVALIVGLTMLSIVTIANLVGAALPFALARFGFDPAVASSPLITTIVDAIGLILYFTIAVRVLAL